MKLFGFAALVTSLALVTLTVHRIRTAASGHAPAESDLRYAIDDLLVGSSE